MMNDRQITNRNRAGVYDMESATICRRGASLHACRVESTGEVAREDSLPEFQANSRVPDARPDVDERRRIGLESGAGPILIGSHRLDTGRAAAPR
jgi:hypothetical protein